MRKGKKHHIQYKILNVKQRKTLEIFSGWKIIDNSLLVFFSQLSCVWE